MPNTAGNGEISNDTEEVLNCVTTLNTSTTAFYMNGVSIPACVGISADDDCTTAYSGGVNAVSQYKDVLAGLSENMNSINGILVEADSTVAGNS